MMNNAFLLFFGVLIAMLFSWFGFVHTPQMQFGKMLPESDEAGGTAFPSPRSGLANRGRDVYRQNGCAKCHTQQVRQGVSVSVIVDDFGTNTTRMAVLLGALESEYDTADPLPEVPFEMHPSLQRATGIVSALTEAGASAKVNISATGADVERGWGLRRTVGRDYLLDLPVMLGDQRMGPDLSNLGNRKPDHNEHFVHLFQPRLIITNSVMPSYPFLFDRLPIANGTPDKKALWWNGKLVKDDRDRQVIPRPEARELVAYLMSLRLDSSLFEVPSEMPEDESEVEIVESDESEIDESHIEIVESEIDESESEVE